MPPGLMPSPPGFLSPAAFPFQPPFPQDDAPSLGPAPVLRGVNYANSRTGTPFTLTPAMPAGVQPGDLILIWCIDSSTNSVWSAPGYAAAPANISVGAGLTTQLLWRNADGTDAAQSAAGGTVTVTQTVTHICNCVLMVYGNPAGGIVSFDGVPSPGTISAGSTTSVASNAVTTYNQNERVIWLGAVRNNSGLAVLPAIVPPPGFDAKGHQSNTSFGGTLDIGILQADLCQIPAATVSSTTGSVTFSERTAGLALALYCAPTASFMPPLPPPGFMSPAGFAFSPTAPQVVSDAPVPGAPYLIGTMAAAASSSLTLTLTAGSNAGDTIVVFTAAVAVAARCTDTRGNSYSLLALPNAQSVRINQFTAVNPAPVKPGDSVTVTWNGAAGVGLMVIGLPGARAGVPNGNLIPDAAINGNAGVTSTVTATIAASSLSRPAEVAVAYVMLGSAVAGPVNWPPDWTVITSGIVGSPGGYYGTSAAYKVLTSKAQVQATFLSAAANPPSGLIITTFMPETRFAPVGPHPDMPPGMQSPGAWQFTPLPRNGAVTGTAFFTAQPAITATVADQVGRQLSGSAATAGTVTSQPGKSFAASATATGTLARAAGKALATTVATAGTLARQAARILTGSTAAAGSLTRQSGKGLATSASTAGSVTRQPGKTFTATAGAAGTITRQAGKALAGAVAASVNLIRQAVRTIAGSAAATGTLTRQAARQLDVTAEAAGSLVRTGPPITFTYDTPYFEWEYGTPYLS